MSPLFLKRCSNLIPFIFILYKNKASFFNAAQSVYSFTQNQYACTLVKKILQKKRSFMKVRGKSILTILSEIGAVVEIIETHFCERGSILGKSCNFLIVSLSNGLSICFRCSDQRAKYRSSSSAVFFDFRPNIVSGRQVFGRRSVLKKS